MTGAFILFVWFDAPLISCSLFPGQFAQSMTDRLEREAVLFPKRYGAPTEFAGTVRFILEVPYINGETYKLTGGTRVPAML